MSAGLSARARTLLPALARAVLEASAAGRPAPEPRAWAEEHGLAWPPEADEPRGVFVTLLERGDGALRGCIGMIESDAPLARGVVAQTLAAAYRDPRFEPVTADELPDLTLEVSVLTPLRPVAGWEEIEIPRHGVLLARDGRRAVFLPQVAREQGWDRATTLAQLCRKAGLPADAWHDGASFHVFEAAVVREDPRRDGGRGCD